MSVWMKTKRVRGQRRYEIFSRDGFACVLCGFQEPPERACAKGVIRNMGHGNHLTVDHIVPRSCGGTSEPDNLRTLCADCHMACNRAIDRGWMRAAA